MSSDPIRKLKSYGHDLSAMAMSRIPKNIVRCGFICVNTYRSYRLNLGTGPINDAVSIAKALKTYFGFEVYFLHNPTSKTFLKYLDFMLQNTDDHLVFFYVGHGTTLKDTQGDENDGYDEAFVFDDGNIVDDVLIDHLIKNKREDNYITLITDACHSGSIWDIQGGNVHGRQLPQNIISIAAAADSQTSKQTMIDRLEQGVFTSNLAKCLKKQQDITPNQLKTAMKKILRSYGQTCTIASTTQSLMDEPLFDLV